MKLLGYSISEGVYNDRPYKNVNLHVVLKEVTNGKGYEVAKIKMKYDNFILSLKDSGLSLDSIINSDINVFFDMYGHATAFTQM